MLIPLDTSLIGRDGAERNDNDGIDFRVNWIGLLIRSAKELSHGIFMR
jgi:hypothetical protein